MLQSNILLTQTYLDTEKLQKIVANTFFTQNTLDLNPKVVQNSEELNQLWQHNLANNQILVANLEEKEDLTKYILEIYTNYNQKTLLFLGNLDNYSELLQEGMLKLLEEPPNNLYIVLFAQNRAKILPTVVSRCILKAIPQNLVWTLLDGKLLQITNKNFPSPQQTAKDLIQNKFNTLPDSSDLQREEINFWLFQVFSYLSEFYKQKPELIIAQSIEKVLLAIKLNQDNVQKKFSLGWLKNL